MDSPGASGRRRGAPKVNAEDQALDQIAKEVQYFGLWCHLHAISLTITPNMVNRSIVMYEEIYIGTWYLY